jgi:hypothetical protein
MADFNFGHVGQAIAEGKHANANIYFGPVDPSAAFTFLNKDFTDFVTNQDSIFTVNGASTDFVWGQRWGNSKTRVAK